MGQDSRNPNAQAPIDVHEDGDRPAPAVSRKPRLGSPEFQRQLEERLNQEEAGKLYQLAFWPDDRRAMPTEFIACALFSGIQLKDAEYLDGVEIANANGFRIKFKGRRLTQVHADVWQGIMHMARSTPEGTKVRFRSKAFLRLIGRHTGKSQRDQLHSWITDLVATNVEVISTTQKRVYFGSMLPEGARDEANPEDTAYVVEINRNLCKLFEAGFATVDWEQRQKLRGKWLALWLQHYFSRFRKPVQVAELHRLSGSGADLKEFRRMLKGALLDVAASGGFEACLEGTTDTVRPAVQDLAPVGRKPLPSPAQRSLGLPVVPAVSGRAKEQFRKRYPDHDAERCLADFAKWLTSKGHTADRPDAAFLGFAKKWVAGA